MSTFQLFKPVCPPILLHLNNPTTNHSCLCFESLFSSSKPLNTSNIIPEHHSLFKQQLFILLCYLPVPNSLGQLVCVITCTVLSSCLLCFHTYTVKTASSDADITSSTSKNLSLTYRLIHHHLLSPDLKDSRSSSHNTFFQGSLSHIIFSQTRKTLRSSGRDIFSSSTTSSHTLLSLRPARP